MHSFNANIAPTMCGVLECDSVTEMHAYGFVIKRGSVRTAPRA